MGFLFRKKRWAVMLVIAVVLAAMTVSVTYAAVTSVRADDSVTYLKYMSDYDSKEEAYAAAYELNQKVVEEGTILLKNEDNILPMKDQKYVTVFGKSSADPAGNASYETTLADSLREVGFAVNPAMEQFYEDDSRSPVPTQNASGQGGPGGGTVAPGWTPNETDVTNISDSLWKTCEDYNDAAFVVIYREAGESRDSAMFAAREWAKTEERGAFAGVGDIPGKAEDRWTREDGSKIEKIESYAHIDDTYLSLSEYEADLLYEVGQRYENIVVVLNVAGTLQPDFLVSDEDGYCDLSYYRPSHPDQDSRVKIKGALWTGYSGDDGLKSLGRIIRGEVNPSGHTVDTWAMDYRKDPTYLNFSVGSISGATGYSARLYGSNRLSYAYDADLARTQAIAAFEDSEDWTSSGDSLVGRDFAGLYGQLSSGLDISPAYYQVSYSEGIYVGYRYWETVAASIAEQNADVEAYDNSAAPYLTEVERAYQADMASDGSSDESPIIDPTKKYNGGVEDAEDWYDDYVVYPLGYGLSYTDFTWDVEWPTIDDLYTKGGELGDGTVDIKVTVTNTGDVTGKDVVQLYYSAPYDSTENIEKSHVVLGDFDKTRLLLPGESQTLTISVSVYDLTSYDMALGADGKAEEGEGGYKLSDGTYHFFLGTDAHHLKSNGSDPVVTTLGAKYGEAESAFHKTYTVANDHTYTVDPDTGYEVNNRFEDVTNGLFEYGNNNNINEEGKIPQLSRSDFQGTFPKPIALKSMVREQSYFDYLSREILYNTGVDGVGTKLSSVNPTYDDSATAAKSSWDAQRTSYTTSDWYADRENVVYAEINENGERVFANGANKGKVIGKDVEKILLYDLTASNVEYGDSNWDAFLNQLTIEEMQHMVGYGGYCTYFIPDLGVPSTINPDGPESVGSAGPVVSNAGDNMLSATWNEDLAYMRGRAAGNEGMWGNSGRRVGDTTVNQSVAGWYAPGGDTHRSPFGGRNNQYFSEDGVLGGRMVAAECQGARDMGMITYIKHFALNDQEACRDFNGLITWATEQSMREIYLRNFEYALRGPALGTMTSLNRIGDEWSGYRYDFLTELLRGEWGFKGAVVTDGLNSWMDLDRMMRCGNDLALAMFGARMPADPFGEVTVEKLDADGNVIRDEDTDQLVYETYDVDTDVQIAALRETCLHILYAASQSHSMLNGACLEYATALSPVDDLGTVMAGQRASDIDASFTDGEAYDVTISKYSVVSGSLPAGLSINADTGVISGTVSADAEPGEYSFTIQARADGWGRKEKACTLTVASLVRDGATAYIVQNVAGELDTSTSVEGASYSVTAGALPDGMSLDASTGVVSGTPTTPGMYTFTVTASLDGYTDSGAEYTIVVLGGQGAQGETGPQGPAGQDGADAPESEGGCGGDIGSTFAIVASVLGLLAAGAVAYTLLRKKNQDK